MLTQTEIQILIDLAEEGKQFSYAPYSKFHVGAALLCEDGNIYKGCNIENASFGPTNCAERTAIFKAVSEGNTSFLAIAIISDGDDYTTPCGVCRQVMAEFCSPEFQIIMCNSKKEYQIATLKELLPFAFSLEK